MDILDNIFAAAQKIGGRYFVAATVAWFIFYILLRSRLAHKKIQQKWPGKADYIREIGYSVATIGLFSIISYFFLFHPTIRPYTQRYDEWNAYGTAWSVAAFPIMLFVHDTYFYFTHRLMHHPLLFKWFHLVHHRSTNPTPYAAYAFHPLEAIVEIGILPVFLFLFPLHILHIAFFFLFMIVYNVYGHLGFELYPAGFHKSWFGKWVNTSVNHNQHHQYFKGNYGLYFLFWDRWLGTIRKDYDQQYEKVKAATPASLNTYKAAE